MSMRPLKISLVLVFCALYVWPVQAKVIGTFGKVYPIAEPDALTEIEARTARLPADMRGQFGPRSKWSAMKAAALAPATISRTRNVVPFYTLDTEIRLPGGEVLYPKGFTFNPLDYVTLPQRLVIVRARDLDIETQA